MRDLAAAIDLQQDAARLAQADLVNDLAELRDRLTPGHIAGALGHSAQAAVAPLFDPLVAQTKSASGMIALGGAAAALFFGLGRASGYKMAETDDGKAETGASTGPAAGPAMEAHPAVAKTGPSAGGIAKALLWSTAAVAAGSFLAGKVPLSEGERQFASTGGRDLKRWLGDNSSEIVATSVQALGITKTIGSLLAIVALATRGRDAAKDGPTPGAD